MLSRLSRWLERAAVAVFALKASLCGQLFASRLDDGDREARKLVGLVMQAHTLELYEDELVVLELKQRSTWVTARVLDPQGRVLSVVDATPGGSRQLSVRARETGEYRVVVGRAPHAPEGEYSLELDSLDELPKQPATPAFRGVVESPRLRALQTALLSKPTAEDAFWRELGDASGPLIEPSSDGEQLVSFLYHGTPATRSVSVELPVFRAGPLDGTLAPLASSAVWFRTEHMPAGTRLSYQFVVDADVDTATSGRVRGNALLAASVADPRNPRRFPDGGESARSVLELPGAEPEPWLAARPDVARGTLRLVPFASDRLGNTHTLALYSPAPEYGPPSALLVMLDGEGYVDRIPVPSMLDQLIAARAIRSTAAVFVYNVTAGSRVSELTLQPKFSEFLATELLPYARSQLGLELAARDTVIAGSSLGGLAAAYTAYRYPEAFGAVLSQSGSFWFWRGDGLPGSPKDEADWLIKRFAEHEPLPIRFYLEAGMLESGQGIGAIRDKTRTLRDVLREKGYQVAHHEFVGGHDQLAWRAGVPRGLLALLPARE